MADIPRSQAKTINLGLFYGMGKNKLTSRIRSINEDKAKDLFKQYHARVPFVKTLMDSVMRKASNNGRYVHLVRSRCRFHLWEPNQYGIHKALPHEDAFSGTQIQG